jgi:uncharacterized membrane protein
MKWGQIFALIVTILALGVASFCAYINQQTVAITIAGIDLVGLATAFIYSTHAQKQEIKGRRETAKTS